MNRKILTPFNNNFHNKLFQSTFATPGTVRSHPLEKAALIYCLNAGLKNLNLFFALWMYSYTHKINFMPHLFENII